MYSTKFDSRLTERLYDLTLHGGADDETSWPDGEGWYGLMRMRRASVIIHSDSQGFVSSEVMTPFEADAKWGEISAEIDAACSDD